MHMHHHLPGTLLILTLLASGCLGCGTSAPSGTPSTSTSPSTPTPAPADLSITVPKGDVEEIDGVLGPSEWARAQRADLVPEGELLLMHDGQYLLLGLRGKPDSLGSVCMRRGTEILVLHSSLGVGTAVYELNKGSWQRTQDFHWTWWDETDAQLALNQMADFEQQNGWLASTMGTGSPGEMEYRIALPEGDVRLAVVYFTGDGSTEHLAWWPAQLADSCRQTALIQGRAAVTLRFQPAQWVAINTLPGSRGE